MEEGDLGLASALVKVWNPLENGQCPVSSLSLSLSLYLPPSLPPFLPFVLFIETVFLYVTVFLYGCSRTHFLDQVSLELTESLLSPMSSD